MTTTMIATEQPNVTPKQYEESDDNNPEQKEDDTNKSTSSFVVLDKTSSNEELLTVISTLKQDLEKEKATVLALQKQKEGESGFISM